MVFNFNDNEEMIDVFWTDNYYQFYKEWYSKYWKVHKIKILWTNILIITYAKVFKEAVIVYTSSFGEKKISNIINTLKSRGVFRIRFLSYNRLDISDKFAKIYWFKTSYTSKIDLNNNIEDIFSKFRKSYRQEINKYIKWKIEWFEFKKTQTNNKLFTDFYNLYTQTIFRAQKKWANWLIAEPKEYFDNYFKYLKDNILIYNLYYNWKIINWALIIKDKNGIYYIKWASDDDREIKKLWWWKILHYKIIEDNLNKWIYDLWWVSENDNNPITRFKMWFGGEKIKFHNGIVVINKYKNTVFNMIFTIYNLTIWKLKRK